MNKFIELIPICLRLLGAKYICLILYEIYLKPCHHWFNFMNEKIFPGQVYFCGMLRLLPARLALRLLQRPVHPRPDGHLRSRICHPLGRHLGNGWPDVDLWRQERLQRLQADAWKSAVLVLEDLLGRHFTHLPSRHLLGLRHALGRAQVCRSRPLSAVGHGGGLDPGGNISSANSPMGRHHDCLLHGKGPGCPSD